MRLLTSIKQLVFHKKSPVRGLKSVFYRLTPYRAKFIAYYRELGWESEESASGPGSTLAATEFVRRELRDVFQKYAIRSFMDSPCGDFNWMKAVDLSGIKYLGIDIVPELVAENTRRFGSEQVQFRCADMLKDRLPAVDLVLCRDCLFHYPNKWIMHIVQNFKESGSKYIFTTTFPKLSENRELSTAGKYRPINLQKSPFNFPDPLFLCDERDTTGKWLGLWRLVDIPESLK